MTTRILFVLLVLVVLVADGTILLCEPAFAAPTDEFIEINPSKSDAAGEFVNADAIQETGGSEVHCQRVYLHLLWVLLAPIAAALLARGPVGRKARPLFLAASLIWLGFAWGGCPCMISSFIDMVRALAFGDVGHWSRYLWLAGLVPVTWLFGRFWCGWACHLGAVQEFLFSRNRFAFLSSTSFRKTLWWLRAAAMVALIGHILLTGTNLFCQIDPFLVIFNLQSATTIGWVLAALLIVLSLFIHRPFCRGFCPIGFLLGLVSSIPGSRAVGHTGQCTNCASCVRACPNQAVELVASGVSGTSSIRIRKDDCNGCTECMDRCRGMAIRFARSRSNEAS